MDKWLSMEQMYFQVLVDPSPSASNTHAGRGRDNRKRMGKPLPHLSASKKEQATANSGETQLVICPPRDGMFNCSLGRRAKAYSAGRLWLAPGWVLQNLEKVGIERN